MISQHTWNHQKRGTWFRARVRNWERCVTAFNCLQWHPKALFWFLPSLLISTFGYNYKYCHKTLPSVKCPSKPLMLVCLPNDDHYIFSPFSPIVLGKQSNPKSHACVPSIDYRYMLKHIILGGSFSAWILPFFPSLAVLFCDRCLFKFYFRSGCGVQFVNKDRLLWSRLSQHSLKQRCIFFCRLAILDNMEESYRGIWRIALWFALA